eukprot:XP_024467292.1 uncharacterized protein LOC112329098 isoform X2 [Populus trichocarpa]
MTRTNREMVQIFLFFSVSALLLACFSGSLSHLGSLEVAARMLTVFEDPTTCREKILKCIRLEFLTFFKFSSFQGFYDLSKLVSLVVLFTRWQSSLILAGVRLVALPRMVLQGSEMKTETSINPYCASLFTMSNYFSNCRLVLLRFNSRWKERPSQLFLFLYIANYELQVTYD